VCEHVRTGVARIEVLGDDPEVKAALYEQTSRSDHMTTSPKAGELLVGACLRLVTGCQVVVYNQHSSRQGNQNEIDVIGVHTTPTGDQEIYSCEVVTHLNGIGYGNYEESTARLRKKFRHHQREITEIFDSADTYRLQLWSPNVQPGLVTRLEELSTEFTDADRTTLDLVINERYTDRIGDLRAEAAETTKQRGELAFRMLQILEHLK